MEFDQLTAEFVSVCHGMNGAQRKQAEQRLVQLRDSANALPLAHHVLASCRDTAVLFHATTMMRDAALKHWPTLSADERSSLKLRTWEMSFQGVNTFDPLIISQLLHVSAVMIKRGMLDPSGPHDWNALLERTCALVQPSETEAASRLVCLRFLESCLNEMSSGKATAIGLSFDFHHKCKAAFEQTGLNHAFAIVLSQMQRSTQLINSAISNGGNIDASAESQIVQATLSLAASCVGWDFAFDNSTRAPGNNSSNGYSNDTLCSRRFAASWRQAIAPLPAATCEFHATLRRWTGMDWSLNPSPLHEIRQLLISLSVVNGPVFESDHTRAAYAAGIISHGLSILDSPLVSLGVAAQAIDTVDAGLENSISGGGGGNNAKHAKHAWSAEQGAGETLDMCTLLRHVVVNFGVPVLLCLEMSMVEVLLNRVAQLGVSLWTLAAGAAERVVHAETLWLHEAFEHAVSVLSRFAQWVGEHGLAMLKTTGGDTALASRVCKGVETQSAVLYCHYVEQRLAMARSEMKVRDREGSDCGNDEDEHEDQSAVEDHLVLVSTIGRACAATSLPLLTRLLQSKYAHARQVATQGHAEAWAETLEEMSWLVQLARALLADKTQGEHAMIPTLLLNHTSASQHGTQDETVVLSTQLLSILDSESKLLADTAAGTSGCSSDFVSPLLAERLLDAAATWTNTYLFVDVRFYPIQSRPPPTLVQRFSGPGGQGLAVFLVNAASAYLANMGHENETAEASLALLCALVQNKECCVELAQKHAFTTLEDAHVLSTSRTQPRRWDPLSFDGSLHSDLLRMLLDAMTLGGANNSATNETTQAKLEHMLAPVAARFQRMTLVPLDARSGVWAMDCGRLSMLYRGASDVSSNSSGGDPNTGGPALRRQFYLQTLPAWVNMASECAPHYAQVTAGDKQVLISTILSNLTHFVDEQFPLVPDSVVPLVCRACLDIIVHVCVPCAQAMHASSGGGHTVSVSLQDAWAADIESVLRCLTLLGQRDALDFSDNNTNANSAEVAADAVGEVVVGGLLALVPRITLQELQYPSLANEYYRLLTSVVSSFCQRLSNNAANTSGGAGAAALDSVLKSLEFGMNQHAPEITRRALEAVYELAKFHYEASQANEAGISVFLSTRDPHALVKLLRGLFGLLVYQRFDMGLVDSMGNALLALIACEQEAYQQMISEFVGELSEESVKRTVTTAFAELTREGGVSLSFGRVNRKQFVKNMGSFVTVVRGVVVVK